MPASEFGAEIREHDGTGVIDLRGEINLGADQALNAAYDAAVLGDPRTVVLNFADVDYINSTGIALIVGLLAKARRSTGRCAPSGSASTTGRSSPSPA